jgi:hypothetical protein
VGIYYNNPGVKSGSVKMERGGIFAETLDMSTKANEEPR